jgi:hypothetical protein
MAMNAVTPIKAAEIMESVIARGDLAELTPQERGKFYARVCESVGLNPMTRPFEYITLNGKLTLYARRECTDQLRKLRGVSVIDLVESEREGVFIITAKVSDKDGRTDAAKGAVTITGLKGDALANALMKAETKAKRRATLSICGLGFLDETEIETIPAAVTNGVAGRATLPKKDAKGIYAKLQGELDTSENYTVLMQWAKDNVERIKLLPEDWQDILRMRLQERILDLKQAKNAEPRVVWDENGERPMTAEDEIVPVVTQMRDGAMIEAARQSSRDPLDIPAALDRRPKASEAKEQVEIPRDLLVNNDPSWIDLFEGYRQ